MLMLSIVTPVRKLIFDQPVKEVTLPAFKGELNVLPGHSPLMTTLTTGVLKYSDDEGKTNTFAISWGYCEVVGQEVSILAETVEAAEEIDSKRAELALSDAKKRLDDAGLGGSEFDKYLRKIERAEVRLSVAKKN